MKNLLLALLLLIQGGAAHAASSWKVESEKRIYFAPSPRVEVGVSEVRASEDAWDYLRVSLRYDLSDAQKEVDQLKNDNPGYSVTRVILARNGNYHLSIPSLGAEEEMETKPGMEGPYFNWELLVPKKDSVRLHEALANFTSFLTVTGSLKATVPQVQVVESVELPASVCQELTANGRDLAHVVLAYPAVEGKIQEIAKEEENRASLREQVLRHCLELEHSGWIYDFAALLKLKVAEPATEGNFKAELKRTVQSELEIPLRYNLRREE